MRKIYPRCMGYDYPQELDDDGNLIPNNVRIERRLGKNDSIDRSVSGQKSKPPAYSSLGYLMPCCWVDPRNMMDLEDRGPENKQLKDCKLYVNLFKEKLKLSNVNSVEEIMLSDEWREFYEALLYDTEKVPEHCHRYCGVAPKFRPSQTQQVNIQKRIEYETPHSRLAHAKRSVRAPG